MVTLGDRISVWPTGTYFREKRGTKCQNGQKHGERQTKRGWMNGQARCFWGQMKAFWIAVGLSLSQKWSFWPFFRCFKVFSAEVVCGLCVCENLKRVYLELRVFWWPGNAMFVISDLKFTYPGTLGSIRGTSIFDSLHDPSPRICGICGGSM